MAGMLSGFLPALMGESGGFLSRMGSLGSGLSFSSMFLALVMSVGIGIVAGIIPAYQASRLKPVDALRFE